MASSERILGVSLGTKSIGVAIIQGNQLVRWQVKTFKGKWSIAKLKTITKTIQRIVEDNSVSVVVLKEPDVARSSKRISQLTISLTGILAEPIVIQKYSLAELKDHCSQGNKSGLAMHVALKYPHLSKDFHKEQKNRNGYYMKMFEAVVVAELGNKNLTRDKF